jgi:hypothetical protein
MCEESSLTKEERFKEKEINKKVLKITWEKERN